MSDLRKFLDQQYAKRQNASEKKDTIVSTQTTRKYLIGEIVGLRPGSRVDGCETGEVLAYLDDDTTDQRVNEAEGTGPRYLVNVGNVFGHGGMYEYGFAESELTDCPIPEIYEAAGGVEAWRELQRGYATDHIRKGFFDDTDLALLGITRADAEKARRARFDPPVDGATESGITAAVIDDLIATMTDVADALEGLTFSEIPEEDGWTPDRYQRLHEAAVFLAAGTIPVRK